MGNAILSHHSCPSKEKWSTERTHRLGTTHLTQTSCGHPPMTKEKTIQQILDPQSIHQAEGGTQQRTSPLFPLGHGPGVPHGAGEAMLPGCSSSRYTDVKYEPNGKVSHSFTLPCQPQRMDTKGFWGAMPVPSTPSVQRQCCQCHEEAHRFDPAGPQ